MHKGSQGIDFAYNAKENCSGFPEFLEYYEESENGMKLVLADNLALAREKYIEAIDKTANIYEYARWEYGLHPRDDLLQAYMDEDALFLYMDGENVVGLAAVLMYQGSDYEPIEWKEKLENDEVVSIHILTTCPEYQRKGVAGKMIGDIIELARARGKKSVRLDTLRTNTPAQAMYSKLGFKLMGSVVAPLDKSPELAEFLYYEYALD